VLVKSAEVDSTRSRDFSIDSLDIWIALISLWSKDRTNPTESSFKEIDLISIFFKVNKKYRIYMQLNEENIQRDQ
jgi:hypothetical protein